MDMFARLLGDRTVNRLTQNHMSNVLAMIRTLTKLSTTPMLLRRKDDEKEDVVNEALDLIPARYRPSRTCRSVVTI